MPGVAAIFRFEKTATCGEERTAIANFPRRDARGPQNRIDNLRILRIERQVRSAGVFIFVQYFLERCAPVDGAEHAALGARPVRMPFDGHEEPFCIVRVDDDIRGFAASSHAPEMSPRFFPRRWITYAVPDGQVGALQTFATANVHNVGIGRRDRDGADAAGRLLVKNRIPSVPEVVRSSTRRRSRQLQK